MLHCLNARFHMVRSACEEGVALRRLHQSLQSSFQKALRQAREAAPIAFFKPSYEQALLLNAWIYGINFPICFASNRIGKTTAFVINALLWILPNDPGWLLFQPYQDHLGRQVQVVPRPPLRAIRHLQEFYVEYPHLAGDPSRSHLDPHNHQRYVTSQSLAPGLFRPAYPSPPIQSYSTIWLGAPDKEWHRSIMMRRWKDWLPPTTIQKWNNTECAFTLDTRSTTNPKPTLIDIQCKSYESRDEKWSGDAVAGIMLSEGFSQDILSEIKQRVAPDAFASWDYTPVEARNIGKKVQLAYRVYKGQEELPLRNHVFTKFTVADAPDHIIPPSKKADLLRMWQHKEEGKARIHGDFFSSSRSLVSKLDRSHHCLPWSLKDLQTHYPSLLYFRSLDPGFDHPTVCVWAALAPNNTWFIYRVLSERGLTIGERARKIIELSNNAREKISFGKNSHDFYYQEVHPFPNSEPAVLTVADYHVFATDQTTGQSYSQTYAREGLPITESTHLAPEARVLDLDRRLDPRSYPYHAHPITGLPPGAGLYFLTQGQGVAKALDQLESLFWDMLQGGPNKGESKDTVPSHGDDELDAICYLTSAPYTYHPALRPTVRTPKDSEPEQALIQVANTLSSSFGTLGDHRAGLATDFADVTSQQAQILASLGIQTHQLSGQPGHF